MRTQLELALGKLGAAIYWAETSGLSIQDTDLSYLREKAYLALARVRIAEARDDPAASFLRDALYLLDRLRESAEAKARLNSVLEILVLQALAFSTLNGALVLAEPEGYIRLFVDEGAPMRALLRQTQARSRVPGYVTTLLSAFGEQTLSDLPLTSAHPSQLAEPLTERERDVLRLLLEGASNREIARRLVLESEHGEAARLQPLWQARSAEPHASHHPCQGSRHLVTHLSHPCPTHVPAKITTQLQLWCAVSYPPHLLYSV